jgi:hypothetical protein
MDVYHYLFKGILIFLFLAGFAALSGIIFHIGG